MIKIPKDRPLHVLSIGTKILMKDVMDQYLRSLGEVKTFYASKMSTAVEAFKEKKPNIIFCEQTVPEGSALEFIQQIGGLELSGDYYFVLATEQASEGLVTLAVEKSMDEVLVKPFSIDHIHQIVERYFEKRSMEKEDWVTDLRTAKQSYMEKRFQEAEELYVAAAKKYPSNSSVAIECADFLLQRKYPQHAQTMLEKILSEAPMNVRAIHLLGSSLKRQGKFREAVEKFTTANDYSPLNTLRRMELAETYLMMAEDQIQTALKAEDENSTLFLSKARFQLVRKDYGALVNYLDAKRAFLSEAGKKDADLLIALAKKLAGIK